MTELTESDVVGQLQLSPAAPKRPCSAPCSRVSSNPPTADPPAVAGGCSPRPSLSSCGMQSRFAATASEQLGVRERCRRLTTPRQNQRRFHSLSRSPKHRLLAALSVSIRWFSSSSPLPRSPSNSAAAWQVARTSRASCDFLGPR